MTKKEETHSVEENLAQDYVPKSKIGDLPMSGGVPEDVQKKMDKTKKEVDKFKDDLVKEFKYIQAVGIVPAQAAAKIEEEYEIAEEERKKKLMHLLVVIPEDKFKEIGKVRLKAIELCKKIETPVWAHIMTPVDLWNLGLDSKFDIVEAFGMSFPVLDKGILGSLRVAVIHKTLVLRKFEKYVTTYGLFGSLVTGTAGKDSDVDVVVIINDTDVKRMPRLELKEKLRGIIYSYIQEATAMAGVKNILNVQIYLLTEFWEAVKDANPVMFTFIRDGIPLFDTNAFLPWKSLLKMGKIKPSPESIDMFMSSGDRMEEAVERKLMDIVMHDLYWSIVHPTQALLMLYGLPPGNVYETVEQFKDVFFKKEKLVEKRYADILKEILIKYYKGYEHGKVKKVTGEEVDKLFKDVQDYLKRLKELREQIEKRVEENTINKVYDDLFGMISNMYNKEGEKAIISAFDKELVKTGKLPKRYLEGLKLVAKVKKELEEDRKKSGSVRKKKKKEKAKNIMTGKEIREIDEARKIASEIINSLIEYNQRCDLMSMDRSRFIIKAKEREAEVFFLDEVFVVEGGEIFLLKNSELKESNPEELRKQLESYKEKKTSVDMKAVEELKNIFGDFDLVY